MYLEVPCSVAHFYNMGVMHPGLKVQGQPFREGKEEGKVWQQDCSWHVP